MAEERKPRTQREKYGEEIRLRRVAAGLTQEALGGQVVCSPTLISHYEAGRRLPKPDDARRIDVALNTDGFFARWTEDLESKFPHYFAEVAELEREATEIRQYGAALIPGLLQTRDYARAVYRAYHPNYRTDDLDEFLVNRLQRGQLLTSSSTPIAWTLLDEAALRRRIGGRQTMADQLHKVADMAESGRLRLHVLPFTSGAHPLLEGSVYLLKFSDAAPLAYVEGLHSGQLLDSPARVDACHTAYTLALGAAAPSEDSVALVRSIAEEHEHA
ncbi:helix-turn-helix domain-containing protein [Streptomyces atroolivaceus]|uniref:helix-turn-helix domain-containing protein n=1 Tax=Streptomyces atroolivaceus TaxID=66869 RepID=UPI002024968C|nr:helix-turn-helix transcriptional regulator [Streptomyces atroolivaceus]